MNTLFWIVGSSLVMALVAMAGSLTLLLRPAILQALLLPLVAFAAGTLLGGAVFHMLPAGLAASASADTVFISLAAGFSLFLALEQFLHWHHCHRAQSECRQPLGYLILIGDGLHNFIGGLAIAGVFLIDIRLGITAWLAAVAHEIPQELGDFAVLVHSGWSKSSALLFNFLSALSFLLGGLLTYFLSFTLDVSFLIPFAAGNFLYIGATDLVPEVNKHDDARSNLLSYVCFLAGLLLMVAVSRI